MIRRDYILRQVQEMAQVLARAIFLRTRQEYDSAMMEIGRALRGLSGSAESSADLDADGWIELCRRHEEVTGPLLRVVGDLLREQGRVLAAAGRSVDAVQARAAALALHLEAILSGAAPVTEESLRAAEEDIHELRIEELPSAVLSRLMVYHEQRRHFAAAEDVLFEWVERDDPAAGRAGREFYARLEQADDAALMTGGLSRAEVAEGRRDLVQKLLARPENPPIP